MVMRENYVGKSYTAYFMQYAWGLFCGAFIYATMFYSTCGIISSDGKVNSLHNAGACAYFGVVMVHNFQVMGETRNWTWVAILVNIVTIGLYWLTVYFNDVAGGEYESNQFSVLFASPLTWISAILAIFVCCLPRYVWFCLD